jgi:hypothetical protein
LSKTIAISVDGYELQDDGTFNDPNGKRAGVIQLLGKRKPIPGFLHHSGMIAVTWTEKSVNDAKVLKRDRFRYWLRNELIWGRIPGVLACVNFLGLNHQGARGSGQAYWFMGQRRPPSGPTLTSRWTKVRRKVFEEAGLVFERHRWRWPTND